MARLLSLGLEGVAKPRYSRVVYERSLSLQAVRECLVLYCASNVAWLVGYLPKEAPSVYRSLLHASDVLPTLAHVGGASLPAEVRHPNPDLTMRTPAHLLAPEAYCCYARCAQSRLIAVMHR